MIPSGLCINCMNGIVSGSVCTSCGAASFNDSSRSANALPLGYILHGRYYIGKVLGAGGFGITYMAWDIANKRRVALKELYPRNDVSRSGNRSTVYIIPGQEAYFEYIKKCFLDEARLLSGLYNTKEIIDVYHLFPDNNTAYYSMEYIDGENLKSYARKNGKMSWTQLSPIVHDVLRQLNILHARNFIHRDISPDNIFRLKNGGAKLIDFGSVRTYNGQKSFTTFLKHNYAPIEQYYKNGNQGPWTDIYALSVTIYYLLSGVLPQKAVDRATNDCVNPLRQLVPSVPQNVSDAVGIGMAVQAQDRFQNVEGFMKTLGLAPPVSQRQSVGGRRSMSGGICAVSGGIPAERKFILSCIGGSLAGGRWNIARAGTVTIGRDAQCVIRYPAKFPGVSRHQCSLALDKNGRPCIRDDNSSYGTFVDGKRIAPGVWLLLKIGSMIGFANERFTVQYL